MRYLLTLAVIFILSLVELSWPAGLKFAGVRPELLLVALIFFALKEGALFSLFPATLAGLIKDIFGPTPLGVNLFLFLLVGLLIGCQSRRFNRESPLLSLVLAGITSCILSSAVYFYLRYSTGARFSFFESLFLIILPVSFYTALVSPVLFFILRRTPLGSERLTGA